jgi:hypothetical protein
MFTKMSISNHRWGRQQCGATALETAVLMPLIILFLLYAMQIGFVLLSHQVTQYAAYMAARSYLVYGEKTLNQIHYPYTAEKLGVGNSGGLFTNGNQTTAEAAAEKIIFESLPWEHERIDVADEHDWYMKRLYKDGIDDSGSVNNGAVRVEFTTDPAVHSYGGVKVTYCMPVLFPGLEPFFTGNFSADSTSTAVGNPCANLRNEKNNTLTGVLNSIPIQHAFFLGREP